MPTILNAQDPATLPGMHRFWAYNGLDCMVTREIWDVLRPRSLERAEWDTIYRFQMACQSPAMTMQWRGIRVDEKARLRGITTLSAAFETASQHAQTAARPFWSGTELETGRCAAAPDKPHKWPRGVADADRACERCGTARVRTKPFNPLSPDQAKTLFYGDLGVAKMYNRQGVLSADDEVLQRIIARYSGQSSADIAEAIQNARAIQKQIGVLKTGLSQDGRLRSSFVVGGTETGRWSSSANAYKEGTNLQNITESLRHIFVSDPGMELFYADLSQAESNCVANLSGDEAYIEAHAVGDPHTFVARLLWPSLPWNGDIKKDKEIASRLRPEWDDVEGHDYRFQAKRVQHGTNYGLSPHGMARIAHLKVATCRDLHDAYFTAFPGILNWQKEVAQEVKTLGVLTTPLGRRRQFFGRTWDDHTIKQALAFVPQSMVADILNTALYQVWKDLDPSGKAVPQKGKAFLLAQVHDAILGEVTKGDDAAIEAVLARMRVPVRVGPRIMTLGVDVSRGLNWGKASPSNPRGMKKG